MSGSHYHRQFKPSGFMNICVTGQQCSMRREGGSTCNESREGSEQQGSGDTQEEEDGIEEGGG